jgi:hypothetical protein
MIIVLLCLGSCQLVQSGDQTGTLQFGKPMSGNPVHLVQLPFLTPIIQIHKILSIAIFRTGVTDLLGKYRDETMPVAWYMVYAPPAPEGVKKTDYEKHWVAYLVHVQAGKEVVLDFSFENSGGCRIK